MIDKELRDVFCGRACSQHLSLNAKVHLVQALGRLCFCKQDLEECYWALYEHDPYAGLEGVLLLHTPGVRFVSDTFEILVVYRGESTDLYPPSVYNHFHDPTLQDDCLRFLCRVEFSSQLTSSLLDTLKLDTHDLLGVEPSIIRESIPLQQLIASELRFKYEKRQAFNLHDHTLLGYVTPDLRRELVDVIKWRAKKYSRTWRLCRVYDALGGMEVQEARAVIDPYWSRDVWAPLSVQAQVVASLVSECLASGDPPTYLSRAELPDYIQHHQAYDSARCAAFVKVLQDAARQFPQSIVVWRFLENVAVEALEDFYVERLKCDCELESWWFVYRTHPVIGALSRLPVHVLSKHVELVAELARYAGRLVYFRLNLDHDYRDDERIPMHYLTFEELQRFNWTPQDMIRTLNCEEARVDLFNTDPRFVAEVLVKIDDHFRQMFPGDTLHYLNCMPRSLLNQVARHQLPSGRTCIDEFVVRAATLGYLDSYFLLQILSLDKECVRSEHANQLVAAWRALCGAHGDTDEDEDEYEYKHNTLLLNMVENRFGGT